MDDEKTTDKLQKFAAVSSSVDKALKSIASHQAAIGRTMGIMASPTATDRTLQSLISNRTAMDRVMAAMESPTVTDRTLQSLISNRTAMDRVMAAMESTTATDRVLKSLISNRTAMDRVMTAMARPTATDRVLQSLTSHQAAMDRVMGVMARPSALDQVFKSISANQASLDHALKGVAKASSVMLAEPTYLSEISQVVSNIDLNAIDLSSIDEEFKNTEAELSSIENPANFVSAFSNLHPLIQAVLFYFLVHIFLPQVNSISANLLTPMVENYLEDNEKSDRDKIKGIKSIPLSLKDFSTDDLRFITGNNVRLRARPSTSSAIHDELVLGQVVTVLSKQRNWIEVMYEYEDGELMSGWVFTRYTARFKK